MALTELQLPTKSSFYSRLQSAATEMDEIMRRWQAQSEFIANIDTADLDAMGVAAGQVRTDLVNFRVAMEELVDFYNGGAVTATNNPANMVDLIRRA
jgi:hypothetical protein